MREYQESTFRNLLRPSLILGLRPTQILILLPTSLVVQWALSSAPHGGLYAVGISGIQYGIFRLFGRYAKTGWEESLFFTVENISLKFKKPDRIQDANLYRQSDRWRSKNLLHPDTQSNSSLIQIQESRKNEAFENSPEVRTLSRFDESGDSHFENLGQRLLPSLESLIELGSEFTLLLSDPKKYYCYQLTSPPISTNPLLLFEWIMAQKTQVFVLTRSKVLDQESAQSKVQFARSSSAYAGSGLYNTDSKITFEESSNVAEALSTGKDKLCEFSLVLISAQKLNLPKEHFNEENSPGTKLLAIKSVLGVRSRFHRSHFLRVVNAIDLIPGFGDTTTNLPTLFKTRRNKPLALNLQDPSFPALHINISGVTGAGKSVVAVALLSRMKKQGVPLSCLFIDQLRSYRRPVTSLGGTYIEPKNLDSLKRALPKALNLLETQGAFVGIELSDIASDQTKPSLQLILTEYIEFLKNRDSHHPVYIVLDECWRLLKTGPVLVQSLFRECRKLDGAAVAITQSISDLIKDGSGEAIFQNTPIQILLKQREDPEQFKSDLCLNSKESEILRSLELRKGHFTECLIKLPNESYLARVELTPLEHELFRTDTVRKELVASRQTLSLVKTEDTYANLSQ